MSRPLTPKRRLIFIWTVAIILPIIVLIVFEYISLSNIKSTHAINAVIQRDFMQTLQVVERKSTDKLKLYASELAGQIEPADLSQEPPPLIRSTIDEALEHLSFADAVFYFDNRRGLILDDRLSLQKGEESDSLKSERSLLMEFFKKNQFHESMNILRESGLKGDFRVMPVALRTSEADDVHIAVYFALPPFDGKGFQIAGFLLDRQFLSKDFFPGIFREMESESMTGDRHDLRTTIIAIHYINQPDNIIASSQPIDSNDFEVGRMMGYGPWRFFVSEIKPKGETIEGIANRYIRWNFLLVTFIVIVLVVGMLLTLSNMAREIQLAQLKSDFVSNVSHELKTPLALIRLFAETLEMNRVKSTERQMEYFGIIRKESDRLTQLINNILDFSRIEAGKKEYNFVRESPALVVRETIDSYRFHVEQQGFTLKVDIDDTLPSMWVDRDALSQAILNLLNNALKYYKDEKYIAVTVGREGRAIRIEVADHGIGISKSDQKRIFEKFYRAANSLVHDTKGSGLGLSLVQHIVKAHGGTVKVESRLGEGSCFIILLPLTQSETEESLDSEVVDAESATTEPPTEKVAWENKKY